MVARSDDDESMLWMQEKKRLGSPDRYKLSFQILSVKSTKNVTKILELFYADESQNQLCLSRFLPVAVGRGNVQLKNNVITGGDRRRGVRSLIFA